MSNDSQENPWPGFVDVLSSTLLVFVFLVIIQLLVIAGVSMKVSQTVTAEMKQQLMAEAQAKVEASLQVLSDKGEGSSLIEQVVHYSNENPVSTSDAKESLAIVYSGLGTLLEDEDTTQVDQWIREKMNLLINSRVQLNAYLGSEELSTSTSYYVSYSRMMDLRKRLVDLGVPGKNIIVRIHESDEEKHNKVELWILEPTP